MILPYLPDKVTTDLTMIGLVGVVVHWRPMDLQDKAKWADACLQANVEPRSAQGHVLALHQQIISIDGLEIETEDGSKVPFKVEEHFFRLGFVILNKMWDEINKKANMTENDVKNSVGPSESANTNGTAPSSAEPALSVSGTNSDASSEATSENLAESQIST